jgi:filamentous hemagglutinin
VINTAINGGSFEKNLGDALKAGILDTVAAQAADTIGTLSTGGDAVLNGFTNKVAHAIAGCVVGAARADNSGGCGAGALGAAIGEMAAEAYGRQADTTQFASMVSSLAMALAGGNASQIQLAGQAGANAAANNFLNHDEAILRERLKAKQRSSQPLTAAEQTQLNNLEVLDIARDLAFQDACKVPGDSCDSARRALNASINNYAGGTAAMTDARLSAVGNAAVIAERDQNLALANDSNLAAQSLWDSFKEFAGPQATGYAIGFALGAYINEARAIYSVIRAAGAEAGAAGASSAYVISNAELLDAGGTVIARQNPITGLWEPATLRLPTSGSQLKNTSVADLAKLWNDPAILPNKMQITVGGRSLSADPNGRSNGVPIFQGASTDEVQSYFLSLSGATSMPVARSIAGKGDLYVVNTPSGNFVLRNFSTSAGSTETSWTIDIPAAANASGTKMEIKFQ